MRNKYTIGEIWDFMPNKFKGMIMGWLLFLLAMTSSKLLSLLNTDIFIINFLMSIFFILGIFKVSKIIYPWISSK